MKYHRMTARIFMLSTLLHLFTAIDRVGSFQNALDWNANNVHGTFGFLAFITTLLIGLTAVEPVRRKLWELFYFSHVMLVPLVFLFTFLHVRKRTAQVIMLVPILMYVLDCLIRGLFMLSRRSSAKSATAKPLGKLATRIEVDTKFPCGFEAGQYVVFDFNTHSQSLTNFTHSLTHSLKNTNTNSQHTGTAGSTFPRYHSSSGIRSRLHLLLPQTKSYSTVVTYIARDRSRTVFELPHRARNSRSIWTVLTVSWD